MDKYRAIPPGYMTVGQAAKKMGITPRTLQYYDKQGVLSPTAQSAGGRRLYTDKDLVRLHQILSMKYLGFSLEDIKTRLVSLDTAVDVANALEDHAAVIRQKMEALAESLRAIEVLKAEVLQMESVDFRKYADIIVNLQIKNEMYWIIKHMDDDLMDYFRGRFSKDDAKEIMQRFNSLQNEASGLKEAGVSPKSKKGQSFAKAFWDIVMEFTGGDMSMMPKLAGMADRVEIPMDDFIHSALDTYLTKLGYDPFEYNATAKEETT